jgi:hypothetical protein
MAGEEMGSHTHALTGVLTVLPWLNRIILWWLLQGLV